VLTLDWLPTRVSDTGGPSKGYLFLVAHTKGIWYWWPVNCHLLTGGPHEGNRWPRHFSPGANRVSLHPASVHTLGPTGVWWKVALHAKPRLGGNQAG
jgi:hypothetical protein